MLVRAPFPCPPCHAVLARARVASIAVVLLLGLLFVLKFVPETKGRTLADIQREFTMGDESREPLIDAY